MRELERDPPRQATAQQVEPASIAIVGAGRVGGSLASAAERAGIDVALARRGEAAKACRGVDAALLCVGDGEIESAAAEVALALPSPRLVGHTSGATGLEALAPAAVTGAASFSIHPLQTVPGPDADLSGCPCAIAGADEQATAFARALAERLGMRPFEIDERARAAYHAAASIASNFLVALEESAADLLTAAGADNARELLAPLVLRTAANWSEDGARALTGPIARGDEATVAAHLEALGSLAPDLIPLYRALAERTAELAGRNGAGGR